MNNNDNNNIAGKDQSSNVKWRGVGDLSRGLPESSLFNSYDTKV